jgi:hypothetical protein
MKLYFTCLLLILSMKSNAQITVDKIITINPNLSFQNYEHYKRLTLNSTDSNIEYLDNFDFEWGYLYKINVTETQLGQTLSDGTQYEYKFNHIVSKTKMADSSQFKLFIDPNRYYHQLGSSEQSIDVTLNKLNDSTYLYFDKVEIEIPEHLKTRFNKIVSGEKSQLGYFVYINEKRIKLLYL